MVLDRECNISIDADADARIRRPIATMRDTLLAEHLGCEVADIVRERDSRVAAQSRGTSHAGRTRSGSLAGTRSVDSSRCAHRSRNALAADELVDQFVPKERTRPLIGRYAALNVLALLIVGVVALGHWTPLGDYLNLRSLTNATQHVDELPLAPLWIVLGYVAAAVVSVPVTLLIASMGIVFGATWGDIYSFAGTTLAAAISFWLGGWLGRDAVRRLAGARVNRLSERVAKRGIVAVVVLRLLPVAPFAIVNLVAGASHIRMHDFMIGTMLDMGPGIFLTVAFANQFLVSLRHLTVGSFVVLIGIGAVLIGLSILLQRFLGSADKPQSAHEGAPSDADKPRASDAAQRASRLRERGDMPRDSLTMPNGSSPRPADEVNSRHRCKMPASQTTPRQ